MGRPRKSDGPPADERIEIAFFEALSAMPFQKITISGIVERASVNRNSLYYHYSGLDDLARSAVEGLLVPEVPRMLARGILPNSEQFEELISGKVGPERVTWVKAVLSDHSTPELRGILRDAVLDAWLETFDLTRADLDLEARATGEFILGGVFEVVRSLTAQGGPEDLTALRRLPVVQLGARTMIESFTRVAAGKGR